MFREMAFDLISLSPGAIRMIGRFFAGVRAAGVSMSTAPRIRLAALPVAVAAVAGCAAMGGLTKDSPAAEKEAVVGERAKARWEALIRKNYHEANGYFSPPSKDQTTLSAFQAKVASIEYRTVRIDKVECAAETCTVRLTLTYDYPQARVKGVVTPLDESWIIDKGQVWYVYRG
jgi:hypothetical protein